jgi:hypothetical protein
MEARTRDGAKTVAVTEKSKQKVDVRQPPRDRILPLSSVEFVKPVSIPGAPYPVKKVVRGEKFPDSSVDCPRLFIDPELQAIVIEGKHFPMHLVAQYELAKAA